MLRFFPPNRRINLSFVDKYSGILIGLFLNKTSNSNSFKNTWKTYYYEMHVKKKQPKCQTCMEFMYGYYKSAWE